MLTIKDKSSTLIGKDQGILLVCNWVNDLPTGRALAFLNHYQYAYLQFSRGQLDGYCYSCSETQMVLIRFQKGRPIDRHLYVNFYESRVRILAFRNGSYQPVQQFNLEQKKEEQIISRYLGVKLPIPPLTQFLKAQFCDKQPCFELKQTPNGSTSFRYVDKSSPLSLGFTVSKKQQLLSYGYYLQGKLHGFGCKIDSNASYEGQFQGGQLHGIGLVNSYGRFTFGRYQMGNLVQPVHLEERGRDALEKLKQLKKKDHLQSIFFENNYVEKDIFTFKGISDLKSQSFPRKYSEPQQTVRSSSLNSSRVKGSNISLNQLISSKLSSKQVEEPTVAVFPPPAQMDYSKISQREASEDKRWEMGSSGLRYDPIRRFPFQ